MTRWTTSDPRWASLNPYQRAALMSLMEAEGANPSSARNALGAMINRAGREGVDLGEHVSGAIYQPTIEPSQQARVDRLMQSPAFTDLTAWAERRSQGLEPDPVAGATHFLAPETTMLSLEAGNPSKYRSWRQWTGFDPESRSYRGVIMRDGSHAFLAPEGAHSAPYKNDQAASPAMLTDYGRQPGEPTQSPQPAMVASAPNEGPKDMDFASILSSLFSQGGAAGGAAPGAAAQATGGGMQMPFGFKLGGDPGAAAQAIPQAPQGQQRSPLTAMGQRQPVDYSRLMAALGNRMRLGV